VILKKQYFTLILKKQYFTIFLQVVKLARDNRNKKLPAYPLLYYCSSRPFFAFIFFSLCTTTIQETITVIQPTTIKMMAVFFLTSGCH